MCCSVHALSSVWIKNHPVTCKIVVDKFQQKSKHVVSDTRMRNRKIRYVRNDSRCGKVLDGLEIKVDFDKFQQEWEHVVSDTSWRCGNTTEYGRFSSSGAAKMGGNPQQSFIVIKCVVKVVQTNLCPVIYRGRTPMKKCYPGWYRNTTCD